MATPPVAPGFQNQQFGEVERIERMPAPPQPMQPRPSLVVGGPAFFTPEGYQAPVQPEQAFMPTDRRPDPIGDNFRRPYERPIMPMPSPTPMPMPSPTPPPEMAQPAPPRVPIEQPIKEPVIDPGPITTQPVMPMPVPTPQPEYDPFAYSDLGSRALGGEYINSMTFHWFDPTTGKGGSTTEGWSRVPDSAKPYTYLNKEEANEAKEKFMTFEDRGNVDTTPKRTPITTPAPAPTVAAPQMPMPPAPIQPIDLPETTFDRSDVSGSLAAGAVPTQADILDLYTPYILGSKNPQKTFNDIKLLEGSGYPLMVEGTQIAPTSDMMISGNRFIDIPKLPTLGSKPSLRRMPMMDDPRER